MRNAAWTSLILALSLLAGSEVAWAEGPSTTRQMPHELFERRTFPLQYLDPDDAANVLRILLDTRKLAVMHNPPAVSIADDPGQLDAVSDLLAAVDRPRERWLAELVLDSGGREAVIRQVEIERGELRLRYGPSEDSFVNIVLTARVSALELEIGYQLDVAIDGGATVPDLALSQGGAATFTDGGMLDLVRTHQDAHRKALAGIFGLDGEGRALFLRFHRPI